MKKNLKFTLSLLGAFIVGIACNNFAMSDIPANFKFAVVDVNSVVINSKEIKSLNSEQEKKIQELQKWLQTAKADVEKQKTDDGKKKLAKKYNDDFTKKQETIKKDYNTKLQTIDRNITELIAKEAKSNGYNLVLTKNVVLFGGDNITSNIIKLVK